jgi:penicillin amidase
MKYAYLFLSGLLLTAWIVFGNYPAPAGLPIPALGKFFSPTDGFWHNTLAEVHDRTADRRLLINHPLAQGSIHFDDRSVPHIFADDVLAASFLTGYVHAADRMWQMDISTRATEGRLSEVLGDRTLDRDKAQIRQGFRQAAVTETDTMRIHFPDDYAALEAYASGVNAYLDGLAPEDYPVEYKLLDHHPLRWSPYRSALLMKGMSQSLSGHYFDAAAEKSRDQLGRESYARLFPEVQPNNSPVVPADGRYPRKVAALPTTAGSSALLSSPSPAPAFHAPEKALTQFDMPADLVAEAAPNLTGAPFLLMPPHPGNGSNNWAVAADRSNTRYPLLASDPHLSLTLPSIWYECQISLPGVSARGVGLPGSPGIMIGFNDRIAYGETNVGHDVTDWFAIEWVDSTRTSYLLDGQPTAARIQVDTVLVKGSGAIILRTPWTVFGPVPFTEGDYANHAMRYLGHDAPGRGVRPHSLVGTFLQLMVAEGYDDYREALRGYIDPAQNFILAVNNGDIAIRPNGGFPLRGDLSGRYLNDGTRSANNWRGYVPFDERPEHKNPARGYVSSANQVSTGPDYPYPYHASFDGYRGRYINRHLAKERTMNQRKMKELQLDSHSLLAEELAPILIARINRRALSEEGSQLLRLVSEWDYNYTAESQAATIFEQWRDKVYTLTFDELPREEDYLRPELWKWTDLLRKEPSHPIFDIVATTDFRETAATLVQRAFDELLENLNGEAPKAWMEARNTYVRHLGAIPGFGSDLIRSPGAAAAPRALSSGHGASWRMVVELGSEPRAWGNLPGGASGDAASEFYDNGLSDWESGRYHELTRWRDTEEARRKAISSWTFTAN